MTSVDICNLSLGRIGAARVASLSEKDDVNLTILFEQTRDSLLTIHPWKFALKRTRLTATGLLNCSNRTITFADTNPDTITDNGNGFATAGFEAGDIATVQDSNNNNKDYRIAFVTAGILYLESYEKVIAETLINSAKLKLYARPAYRYNVKYAKPSDCLSVIAVNETTIYNQSVWDVEGKCVVTDEIDGNNQILVEYIKQMADATLFPGFFISCLVLKLAAELSIVIAKDETLHNSLLLEFQNTFLNALSMDIHRGHPDESFPNTSWQRAGR